MTAETSTTAEETPTASPSAVDSALVFTINDQAGLFTHTKDFTDMRDPSLNGRYIFRLLSARDEVEIGKALSAALGGRPYPASFDGSVQGVDIDTYNLAYTLASMPFYLKDAPPALFQGKAIDPNLIRVSVDALRIGREYGQFAATFRQNLA